MSDSSDRIVSSARRQLARRAMRHTGQVGKIRLENTKDGAEITLSVRKIWNFVAEIAYGLMRIANTHL
jgi:hypothetical protein